MRSVPLLVLSCLLALACRAGVANPEDEAIRRDEQALRDAGFDPDGTGLLALFRQHTTTATDETRVRDLIHQMGNDRFKARERASAQLTSLGTRAVPMLRVAMQHRDLEVARRAERCLQQIEEGESEILLAGAARVLAARKPAGAERVLLDYLEGADKDYLIEAALDALAMVAVKEGKPAAILCEALVQRQPNRRASAALALTRAGVIETRPAVRRLLDDSDAYVRLRVGLALALSGDRDAVRPLIELLGELPASETGLVEDLLYRLAGASPPQVASGTGAAARKQARDAWLKWYETNAGKLNLGQLAAEKPAGHTLAVLLDAGKILDLDAAKKVRWQIEGLQFPLDAQILPGERVLVAEYEGDRVTERNSKGTIVWEKKIGAPLAAQRLPGGNTFIATPGLLVEVDPQGKEVWTQTAPRGGRIMKANRLRNGNVAVITLLGTTRFHEIDRAGKEIRGFPVEQRTSGGRVEVLPGGHVLVTERDTNRVVELDYQGKPAWEARFEQPVAAVRLPNGHTLVTSMAQFRAVELDRGGREVWEYRADTRVTRAWRY